MAHSHRASGNAEGLAGHGEMARREGDMGLPVLAKAGKWMYADVFDINVNVKCAVGCEIALPYPSCGNRQK